MNERGDINMDALLTKQRLNEIYEQAARYVTEEMSGIHLSEGKCPLTGEICTVYTYFVGNGVHSGLAFYAEAGLFKRLTQHMMQSEEVEPQDVEDFTKEYFNVLCGNITAAMYHDTKVAARFQFPEFCRGRYQPGDQCESWELGFHSDHDENARLVHYKNLSA